MANIKKTCEDCGKDYFASTGSQRRCPKCREKHLKEYQKQYYKDNKADYAARAFEYEERRKNRVDESAGASLAEIARQARALGLTYGKYMALLQSGGLDNYIRERERARRRTNAD